MAANSSSKPPGRRASSLQARPTSDGSFGSVKADRSVCPGSNGCPSAESALQSASANAHKQTWSHVRVEPPHSHGGRYVANHQGEFAFVFSARVGFQSHSPEQHYCYKFRDRWISVALPSPVKLKIKENF